MTDLPLTPHQQEVYDEIVSIVRKQLSESGMELSALTNFKNSKSKMFSLEGYAGVGKTFTTAKLIKEFLNLYNVTVTTPTHKALKVIKEMLIENELVGVKCSTIHSFLNLKMKQNYSTGKEDLIVDTDKEHKTTDILIVDESSMISEELFKHIDEAVKRGSVKFVLFVGDPGQIKPIGENYSAVYKYVKQRNQLEEVMRCASDSDIIQIATRLRKCIASAVYPKRSQLENWLLKTKFNDVEVTKCEDTFLEKYLDDPDDNDTVCCFKNDTVNQLNYILRTCIKGEDSEELVVGDVVIFQAAVSDENDEMIYANNEEVTIKKITNQYDEFNNLYYFECMDYNEKGQPRFFKILTEESQLKYDEILYNLANKAKTSEGVLKKESWKKFFELKAQYQDVKFSYSATATKSQGSSYRKSFVNMKEILDAISYTSWDFCARQLYVAITRAKEKLIILV